VKYFFYFLTVNLTHVHTAPDTEMKGSGLILIRRK